MVHQAGNPRTPACWCREHLDRQSLSEECVGPTGTRLNNPDYHQRQIVWSGPETGGCQLRVATISPFWMMARLAPGTLCCPRSEPTSLTLKGPSPGGWVRTAAADGVPDSGTPTAPATNPRSTSRRCTAGTKRRYVLRRIGRQHRPHAAPSAVPAKRCFETVQAAPRVDCMMTMVVTAAQ
jgi:hypothetical protein